MVVDVLKLSGEEKRNCKPFAIHVVPAPNFHFNKLNQKAGDHLHLAAQSASRNLTHYRQLPCVVFGGRRLYSGTGEKSWKSGDKMVIERITLREIRMPLVSPFETSFGTTTHRRRLLDLAALRNDLIDLLGREVDVINESSLYWLLRRRCQEIFRAQA